MYMTDHAVPRCCDCIFAPTHRSNPDLAPEERFWRPYFVRPKKRWGQSMKHKLLEMVQVVHTNEIIFVWSLENGNGRQNNSLGAKTGLLRRAGAKT